MDSLSKIRRGSPLIKLKLFLPGSKKIYPVVLIQIADICTAVQEFLSSSVPTHEISVHEISAMPRI